MNIKTWQERLDKVSDERIVSSLMVQQEMQAEIDELRAELKKVTVERDYALNVCDSYVAEITDMEAANRVLFELAEAANGIRGKA